MKPLLTVTAILETATGAALLAAPSPVVRLLLGALPESPESITIARIAGAALGALGIACWQARGETHGRAARGLVVAMLFYNIAAVAVLANALLAAGLTGPGLWPAAVAHLVLGAWCAMVLAAGRAMRSLGPSEPLPALRTHSRGSSEHTSE